MFRLTRYFSLASLLAIGVAALLLGQLYQRAARQDLYELSEQNNLALTSVLSNTLWPRFGKHLADASTMEARALQADPDTRALRDSIVALTRGMSVLKVKIYDLKGKTVFSTELKQIGEDKSANQGFVQAARGTPASEISHRDSFSAFEQTVSDRDLISSYIPVRRSPSGPVEAVFEVYDDITPHLGHIAVVQERLTLSVAAILIALYAALFLIVRRADRLIGRQSQALTDNLNALSQARDQLETRVEERTRELAATNEQLRTEVAERRLAEAALAQALEAAQQASRAKSRFLSNMSHELRTPMIGVLGSIDLLEGSGLDGEQQTLLGTARRSGLEMMSIVNTVLDFANVESGQLRFDSIPFDPRSLVCEVAQNAGERARASGLGFGWQVDAGIGHELIGDPARLRQILNHLLDNALKFTGSGEIHLAVTRTPGVTGSPGVTDATIAPAVTGVAPTNSEPVPADAPRDDRLWLRFEVSDTGIGLTAEAQALVFEAFVQAEDSDNRRFGGTGLGLAICRQLVEQMGGRIGVDSVPGEGASFWFTLPLNRPSAPAEPCAPAAATLDPLRGHLLLVEDNPVNQLVARRLLNSLGLTVDVVADGAQAVSAVAERSFDLVLMDCQMPVMDGYEATRAIRAMEAREPQRPHLPIVALTANTLAQDREACLQAGMDEHLGKPYQRERLHEAISRFLPQTLALGAG